MKVVLVSGSPRRGNTEWMLRKLSELLTEKGVKVELILLRQRDIKLCRGCLSCEAGGKDRKGLCKIKDDMNSIYPELIEADCWVFGTPAYFELLSGLLKNFMDRTVAIWPRLEGKPMAGLAVAEEGIGQAIQNLKTYATLCGMPWVGSVTCLAKNAGEIANNKSINLRLKRLADKIIDSIKK
ncbi:MAG: flavodoxin family protein [Dehalococcoidales bacterium]|nr:flavodoxin family protein [Dehalococcoidales bacterium]